jgi:glutaconate CoA-transferase subunit A
MNRQTKEKTIKLKSVQNAVSQIPSGAKLAMGGSYNRRHPMALVHELIRQRKTQLTLYGWNNGIDYDLLIAAKLVKEASSSYVGMANLGLALNFKRACEQEEIRYIDHTETTALDRFVSSGKGLSFSISKVALHSDLMKQPEFQFQAECPFTGEKYVALEAWRADYALIHGSRADKYGNIQFDAIRMMENEPDIIIAKSAKKVIVTVEEIVDTQCVMESKFQTLLPAFLVDSVCLAPQGAHPNSCDSRYDFDLEHGLFYQQCSRTGKGIQAYMEEFILGTNNFGEYLSMVAKRKQDMTHGKL